MVSSTGVLGQPRDPNLKPRAQVRVGVCKNALTCCFTNLGLACVFGLIYEQKYDFHFLELMGFSTHPLFTPCSFSLLINWEDGTHCPFLFCPTLDFRLISRIKQASFKNLTLSAWMYISRTIKKNRMFSVPVLPRRAQKLLAVPDTEPAKSRSHTEILEAHAPVSGWESEDPLLVSNFCFCHWVAFENVLKSCFILHTLSTQLW